MKIIVSVFLNTFQPSVTIPSAPTGRQNIHYPQKNANFIDILSTIKSGHYEKIIDNIRGGKADKKSLPCFTPAGTFRIRTDAELINYTGVICLDYDNVRSVFNLKEAVKELPTTLAAFISPSMKGVKVFVLTDGIANNHKDNFATVAAYYNDILKEVADTRAQNISRLCYLSVDRDLYFNDNPDFFQIQPKAFKKLDIKETVTPSVLEDWQVKYLIEFTEKQGVYYNEGSRNEFIYRLACNFNRYGFDIEVAKVECEKVWQQNTDKFSWAELMRTVKSAYKAQSEFNTYSLPAKTEA